jgi:hypothetical protein
MGLARRILDRVVGGVLSRVGERVVTHLGDTSSDAPSKFTAPKRKAYDSMREEGKIPAADDGGEG